MADVPQFSFGDLTWDNATEYPTLVETENGVRTMMQKQPDAIKAYLNGVLVNEINTVLKPAIEGKQDELTFDDAPTEDSSNPVKSGGVKTALDGKLGTAGGTMAGAIAMAGNLITGLGTPTNNGDAATKEYVDALTVNGAKIAQGTYVGTGQYGSSHKNSLTFSFEPQLVLVAGRTTSGGSSYPRASLVIKSLGDIDYGLGFFNAGSGDRLTHIKWTSSNTLTWYSTENAQSQYNASDITYYWVAIG